MSARITRKSFDPHAGAIVVSIEDDLGARTVHTIHVLAPDGTEADVAAAIAAALEQADRRATRVRAAFEKHGWTQT
jgi:hypothetical protein